jgi:hypothetical protein
VREGAIHDAEGSRTCFAVHGMPLAPMATESRLTGWAVALILLPALGETSREESLEADFARSRTLVEEAIRTLGVEPSSALAKGGEHQTTWTLQRGSAAILITLTAGEAKPTGSTHACLRVISPIMTLPDEDKRAGLYKHLLELNAQGLANAAFGLLNDRVVAVSERSTQDLQRDEVSQMVRHLAAVADNYDDRLVKAFGGKLASDPSLKRS